jgi:hypothetical protein
MQLNNKRVKKMSNENEGLRKRKDLFQKKKTLAIYKLYI